MIYSLHLLGLAATAVVSLGVARWVRRQTDDRAGTAMVALLVLHATMAILAIAQLASSSVAWKLAWAQLWYALGLVAPLCWFLLAVYYTGRGHWLTKPVWIVLLASSVVPLVVWLTDVVHGLGIAAVRVHAEPFAYVQPIYSELTLMLIGAINVYTVFAFGLFLQEVLFARRGTRRRAAVVLGGLLAIFVTTAIAEAPFVPAPGFPYGIYGGGIFGALVAVGLFRRGMFVALPTAREVVFDSVGDAIVVVDADRRVVDFNETAAELFPELDGRANERLEDVYPVLLTGDDEPDVGGGKRAETDDGSFADDVRVARDGETRTLRINVSEITSGGDPRGYALILRDVTESEEYAAELERKTERLEQFAEVLSHDLRNPVTVATGYLELAEETGDPEHVREVAVAVERIDETIEDLLTLSREGEAIDELESVSLYRAAVDAWVTSATDDVTLENEIDPAVRVRADPSRLRTLFENLFRNVADHGGETVSVAVLDGNGDGVGFLVEDDGPGIPDGEQDRIFELGYTSDGGTGLGLSIVDSIADAHGWDLRVTEGRWGGARFEVDGLRREESVDRSTDRRDRSPADE